jgi:hypothetical protein
VPHPPAADLRALLEAIAAAGVEVIVVGGVAAVLHGAPITTQDLDVVYRRSADNLNRLEELLQHLDAEVRDPAGRHLRPERSHLEADGMLLLNTRLGPFDPISTLADGRGYEELLPHTETVDAGDLDLKVLDLPTLVEVKSQAGRAKDRAVLPLLLALLRERSR